MESFAIYFTQPYASLVYASQARRAAATETLPAHCLALLSLYVYQGMNYVLPCPTMSGELPALCILK